jgi:hypothetical protein
MTRALFLLFAGASLLLSACATYTDSYQERLKARLLSPFGVEFLEEAHYPGQVLCGRYSAYEENGFVRRTRNYIVTPTAVMERPSEEQIKVFCSTDAELALFEHTGIGGPGADWSALAKVARDLEGLRRGVRNYYNSAYVLPASLQALVAWDEKLDAGQLQDPWGRPYEFQGGTAGRTLPNPRIWTLGADGAPGGSAADADISLAELPLLLHVLSLRDN